MSDHRIDTLRSPVSPETPAAGLTISSAAPTGRASGGAMTLRHAPFGSPGQPGSHRRFAQRESRAAGETIDPQPITRRRPGGEHIAPGGPRRAAAVILFVILL